MGEANTKEAGGAGNYWDVVVEMRLETMQGLERIRIL